jgi:glycosyltransferase involved in cell wall biosynthesis
MVPTNSQKRTEVAVVVPCYNVEGHLERALDSVLAQTYRDFCIYAIDDGSTDGTAEILKRYSYRGVCAHQIHAGPAAARNRGIHMSESRYVAFLDADDEWLPTKLERQISLMKRDPGIGLCCSGCAPTRSGMIANAGRRAIDAPTSGRLFEELLRDCFVYTPTVVVRRECLKEVGLFDTTLAVSEDFNLWLRIAARWKIAVMPEVLAIRHSRPESLSVSTDIEVKLRSGIAGLEGVRSACRQKLSFRERQKVRRALAERYYGYGSYLLSTRARNASRSKLLRAWTLQPSEWRAFAKLGLTLLPEGAFRSFMGIAGKFRMRLRPDNSARI